ncbi:MAG: phosphoribosylamine--glycine ligase [Bdellovibrionota bacterium]
MIKNEKVLVIGSGGREHALVWHLLQFGHRVECAPGSDAISEIAPVWGFKNFDDLLSQIKQRDLRLVIVGPEVFLADGLVDFLEKNKIATWGPNREAAQLETDKSYSKSFCLEMQIPTARAECLTDIQEFDSAIQNFRSPYVIKAAGLAAGKGVWIGEDKAEAKKFAKESLDNHSSLLIEDFISGREISCFYLVDGENFLFFGAACDHKRLLDEDVGPNTGGMGAYSPPEIWSEALKNEIETKILIPTLQGLTKRKTRYRGFLFLGLMINSKNEPLLIEYNCRMGDPETQVILPRLKISLLSLIEDLDSKKPVSSSQIFSSQSSLAVIGASKEYPSSPSTPVELSELSHIPSDCFLFHAGTKKEDSQFYGVGGRLFALGALANDLGDCRQRVYSWLEQKKLDRKIHFRKDIGSRKGENNGRDSRI